MVVEHRFRCLAQLSEAINIELAQLYTFAYLSHKGKELGMLEHLREHRDFHKARVVHGNARALFVP